MYVCFTKIVLESYGNNEIYEKGRMMDFRSKNIMIPPLCDIFVITINQMISFVFFRKKLRKRNGIKKERRNEALLASKIVPSIVRFISLYTQV